MGQVIKLKRGDLRQAVIDYAARAALDGHIEVMSLRQAARDLGVSSGAVYRHFADKDSLLVEIVLMGHIELREKFFTARPEGNNAKDAETIIDRARQITTYYIEFAHEKPALWHMMFGRIGMLARQHVMKDPDLMRYTPLDAVGENLKDLYRLGLINVKPDVSDVRFVWSATHGAADLAQSGLRMDSDQLERVIEETVVRSLRSVGYNP